MVSDHISIRPRQRVLDPFQFHDQLDAGSRFWGDTEILLAANSKPPKLTPHPQRSELVLPVFRASSTETPRSRPESVTELCFVKKYAFMEADVFRIVQECLTNIHRHSGNGIAKVRVSRSDTDLRVEVEDQGKGISPAKTVGKGTGWQGGIRSMRERIRQLGGGSEIGSQRVGGGMTLVSHSWM